MSLDASCFYIQMIFCVAYGREKNQYSVYIHSVKAAAADSQFIYAAVCEAHVNLGEVLIASSRDNCTNRPIELSS